MSQDMGLELLKSRVIKLKNASSFMRNKLFPTLSCDNLEKIENSLKCLIMKNFSITDIVLDFVLAKLKA